MKRQSILIATDRLEVGGSEIFSFRLANALARTYPDLTIYYYIHHADIIHQGLLSQKDSNVIVIFFHPVPWMNFIAWKFHSLSIRLGYDLRERLKIAWMERFIREKQVTVVNSHAAATDMFFCELKTDFRLVTTLHGHYENEIYKGSNLVQSTLTRLKVRALKLIYLADRSKRILVDQYQFDPASFVQIFNGYSRPFRPREPKHPKIFTFGMVCRPIPEKGWKEAILAFQKLESEFSGKIRLTLVGVGDLKASLSSIAGKSNITFVDQTSDADQWISEFDVGLLPSYLAGESLPNFIVECLARAVPVIATDVGQISGMLSFMDGQAGVLIGLSDHQANIGELYEAMKLLFKDRSVYERMVAGTKHAFSKFEMEKCTTAYLKAFEL